MEVRIFYLEMRAPSPRLVAPPRAGLTIVRAIQPTVAYYWFLYDTVGKAYHWSSRRKLSDAELAAVIHDPGLEIHVLFVDGTPAGFAELDRRVAEEIELVQFGLMPEFIGQGLGRYFLQWTIEQAWSYQPRRLWLHTCTLDHPAAMPNYQKAGFVVYKEALSHRDI